MSDLKDRVAISSTARAPSKGQQMEAKCATREGYLSSKVFVKGSQVRVSSGSVPVNGVNTVKPSFDKGMLFRVGVMKTIGD